MSLNYRPYSALIYILCSSIEVNGNVVDKSMQNLVYSAKPVHETILIKHSPVVRDHPRSIAQSSALRSLEDLPH